LVITSILRSGASTGAQLVAVNNSLVAKIYDPLYCYSSDDRDVVACAEQAYCHEAAAYSHLQKHSEISLNLSTSLIEHGLKVVKSRDVHLILIEYLRGVCMVNLDPYRLSEYVRWEILKQCIEAEIRMLYTGLDHSDFVPRNIIILGSDYHTPQLQVKVVDFEFCRLLAHPGYSNRKLGQRRMLAFKNMAPRVANPVQRYCGGLAAFADLGWCSDDRFSVQEWLWDTFGNDDRYVPAKWALKRPGRV
ncbi:hypothetical protein C7974DRAFT_313983, partial [Boeremia exigua]|uniref:uncharacterized protein n=1 Tax=Boeremia exigua TaxID=749465 RepID=UPI001E8DA533